MIKELTEDEMLVLFDKILEGKVDRFGQYRTKKYNLSIYLRGNAKQTATQRVKACHQRRRDRGLCIECGVDSKGYSRCEKCRKRQRLLAKRAKQRIKKK